MNAFHLMIQVVTSIVLALSLSECQKKDRTTLVSTCVDLCHQMENTQYLFSPYTAIGCDYNRNRLAMTIIVYICNYLYIHLHNTHVVYRISIGGGDGC